MFSWYEQNIAAQGLGQAVLSDNSFDDSSRLQQLTVQPVLCLYPRVVLIVSLRKGGDVDNQGNNNTAIHITHGCCGFRIKGTCL